MSHVPLPKGRRPIREVKKPTGLDWSKLGGLPQPPKDALERPQHSTTVMCRCGKPALTGRATCSDRCARVAKTVAYTERTHCPHGHEYTPENTYVNARGHRSCKTCRRDTARRYYREKLSKAARNAQNAA